MREKIVGILGGMGPDATIDIFQKIVMATPAVDNEEHLRILIDNNPKMPSRQDAILHNGPSPVPAMIESCLLLARSGADFLIFGSHTSHWFHADVQKGVPVPILHIIEECVAEMQATLPEVKRVGILASPGALRTNMFQDHLIQAGLEPISPLPDEEKSIIKAILDFKHTWRIGPSKTALLAVSDRMAERGAQALIMGCTEIPVILAEERYAVPLIDPNRIMAKVAVAYARGEGTPVSARPDR